MPAFCRCARATIYIITSENFTRHPASHCILQICPMLPNLPKIKFSPGAYRSVPDKDSLFQIYARFYRYTPSMNFPVVNAPRENIQSGDFAANMARAKRGRGELAGQCLRQRTSNCLERKISYGIPAPPFPALSKVRIASLALLALHHGPPANDCIVMMQ